MEQIKTGEKQSFTQQLQQDYPKAWEAFREWYGTDELSFVDWMSNFEGKPHIVQQGVLEAFGRSRGYNIEVLRMPDGLISCVKYETKWISTPLSFTDHEPAHKAAVTAMFAEIEKEIKP